MQEGRHKKTSLEKYSPLTLFVRFACERMLETSYFDPTVMTVTLCLSCSPDVGVNSIGAFLRASSVGCGLPYHIWSLAVWNSAGNCIGGFPSALLVGCGLPYHIWSLLATAWDPNSTELNNNSTELNNNSTPTRSPTGSLNRMFNRHQAEITVMQFRGYSLPVHDCSGTMRPSPCPIS